jgi:fatty-acyl-CoA synthase
LRYTLQRSRMKAMFLWHKDKRADYEEILGRARHGLDLELRHTIYFDSPEWPALLDAEGRLPDFVANDDVANIQYTSGTTGMPKGVMLTHHNIVNDGQFLAEGFHYTEVDKIVMPMPLFHCYGCVIGTMSALNSGAALILPNWTYEARATLQAVHDERGTSVYGVPTMYVAEMGLPDFASFDLTSLRTGMMSGAPCPVELMKRVLDEMHCKELVIAYGQTETSPVCTMSDASDSIDIRVNTVGRAMPQTEIRIASTETSETLPIGKQGEVCARGFVVMKGYDGDPEGTAAVIHSDGWLHTGDLGIMRSDGCIHLTGRSRDVIIRGGENIYPREVEEFLYTFPKVGEVQVVGIPNARLGEIVVAWVQLRPGQEATEAEIKEFCQGQIAYYKIPEHIRFVDEFPATLSGKIQKYKIRDFEIEARGLHTEANAATA